MTVLFLIVEKVTNVEPCDKKILANLEDNCNIYQKLTKFAGAGTDVPITGFANSVAAPAIESKSEGFIMGVGAKLFTISGPVIVYGILTSVIYGVIYWIVGLF